MLLLKLYAVIAVITTLWSVFGMQKENRKVGWFDIHCGLVWPVYWAIAFYVMYIEKDIPHE